MVHLLLSKLQFFLAFFGEVWYKLIKRTGRCRIYLRFCVV
nr:MAG TPA: hypothetical protein [Caudoviricetes sp.]